MSLKSHKNIAFVTGINGQDGAYLSELLLEKGYIVHGMVRRSSTNNRYRLDPIFEKQANARSNLILHYGDMTDMSCLMRLLYEIQPTEIYNLAAQSHVAVSFETPEYTANVDALGALRMLEAVHLLKAQDEMRIYQASTSELYGKVQEIPQTEKTPFYPRSPYGVAKLYAYWATINYREAYGFHASNGILFNHESPVRGEAFVTRKISKFVARIFHGAQDYLALGNLGAKRDWGHARDYVEGMWRILQSDTPDDYVLATGEAHSVREFIEKAFACINISIEWQGNGVEEIGVDKNNRRTLIKVDSKYFRPSEVDFLLGDSTKAKEKLGWIHKTTFSELVKEMVQSDIENFKR